MVSQNVQQQGAGDVRQRSGIGVFVGKAEGFDPGSQLRARQALVDELVPFFRQCCFQAIVPQDVFGEVLARQDRLAKAGLLRRGVGIAPAGIRERWQRAGIQAMLPRDSTECSIPSAIGLVRPLVS